MDATAFIILYSFGPLRKNLLYEYFSIMRCLNTKSYIGEFRLCVHNIIWCFLTFYSICTRYSFCSSQIIILTVAVDERRIAYNIPV